MRRLNINYNLIFVFVITFSFIAQIILSGVFFNELDTLTFHLPWAKGVHDNFFGAYKTIPSLNYPPMFPSVLGVLYPLLNHFKDSAFCLMIFLKIVPVMFNHLIATVTYLLFKNESNGFAFLCSVLWIFNPSAVFNSACWGQTDCMLSFFLIVSFYFYYKRKPITATFLFALSALLKLQSLFLAPVVFCELIFFYDLNKIIKSVAVGLFTYLLGWLPFMVGAREIFLPFRITFGGFNTYQFLSFNAANIYYLFPFNKTTVSINSSPFTETLGFISTLTLFLLIAGVFYFYYFMKKNKFRVEAAVVGVIYLNAIFILTTKMHERYQIPVMALIFLTTLIYKRKDCLILYLVFSVVTFLNQAIVIFTNSTYPIIQNPLLPLQLLCVVNVTVFIISLIKFITSLRHD